MQYYQTEVRGRLSPLSLGVLGCSVAPQGGFRGYYQVLGRAAVLSKTIMQVHQSHGHAGPDAGQENCDLQ